MKRNITCLLVAFSALTAGFASDDALMEIKRAFLGVRLGELTQADREGYTGDGVRVEQVITGSAAESSGLNKNDIIVSIDGREVTSSMELISLLGEYRPEDKVTIKVVRGNTPQEFQVVLGEQVQSRVLHPKKWVEFMDGDRSWLGIRMNELNPQLNEFFKVEGGVLVEWVEEGSPAAIAGLKAGDIITRWENDSVGGTEDIYAELNKAQPGDAVLMTLSRGGKILELTVALGAAKDNPNWNKRNHFNFDFNPEFKLREKFPEGLDKLNEEALREQFDLGIRKHIEVLERQLEELHRKLGESKEKD